MPQRDPMTGRYIKTVPEPSYEATHPVAQDMGKAPVFVVLPWKRCKEWKCGLNKGHQGSHAQRGHFGVHSW